MLYPAQTQPAPAIVAHVKQHVKHDQDKRQNRLKTDQMYRDYMQTGSIYYNANGTQKPAAKVITRSKNPVSVKMIQEASRQWIEKQEQSRQP